MVVRRRPSTTRMTGAWNVLPANPKPTRPTVSMDRCRRASALPAGFLVETDHVSGGILESRGDLRGVGADRLHEHAAVGDDGVNRRGHAVHHDVEEKARLRPGLAARYPGTAHLADRIVERGMTIAPLPEAPTEDFPVEVGGAMDVEGGNLEVADLAVGTARGHRRLPGE